jgi:hypothetical protein
VKKPHHSERLLCDPEAEEAEREFRRARRRSLFRSLAARFPGSKVRVEDGAAGHGRFDLPDGKPIPGLPVLPRRLERAWVEAYLRAPDKTTDPLRVAKGEGGWYLEGDA